REPAPTSSAAPWSTRAAHARRCSASPTRPWRACARRASPTPRWRPPRCGRSTAPPGAWPKREPRAPPATATAIRRGTPASPSPGRRRGRSPCAPAATTGWPTCAPSPSGPSTSSPPCWAPSARRERALRRRHMRARATAAVVFAATMALAGFLLFLVQPLLAKYLLPWFGGSAATWLVCLLFFPLALPRQVAVQLGVLAASLILLPITPAEGWKPQDAADPTWRIVALLAVTVGLPYVALAATTPLLSRWLAHLAPSLHPARFFAASNLGSFAGLLSYPFLFERLLSSQAQTLWWSWGFGLYAALFAACGLMTLTRATPAEKGGNGGRMSLSASAGRDPVAAWLGLSALGSA